MDGTEREGGGGGGWAGIETQTETDRQTDKQIDRQTDKASSIQTVAMKDEGLSTVPSLDSYRGERSTLTQQPA